MNLLRPLAEFLEEIGPRLNVEVRFQRDDTGEIDLSRRGIVRVLHPEDLHHRHTMESTSITVHPPETTEPPI